MSTITIELQFVAQLATPGRVAGDVACAIRRAFERGEIRDRNGAALLSAPHIRIDPKGV